jgi:hypothetical protein
MLEDVELEVTEFDDTKGDDVTPPDISHAMSLFSRFRQRTMNE